METQTVAGEQTFDHAPMPTARTLRRRHSLVVQLWRFAMINLRMARMIRRSHQHPVR